MLQETNYILHRRFDRMGRLVGDPGMQKIMNSHVMVIGVGGVGSWAAESLARSGVGRITLVDFDEICITNTNRQLHALTGLLGQKKAQVLTDRLRKINPQARFDALPIFYSEENCTQIFAERPDYVLDCIDNLTAKSHLISFCRQQGIPLIVSTGAAARLDPSMIQVADLAKSHTDPMAQQLRKILRTKHEFPRDEDFGVPCVFSDEEPMLPVELHYDHGQGFKCVCPQGQNDLHSCDKRNRIYGTASFVTGSFGFHMASWVIRQILQKSST